MKSILSLLALLISLNLGAQEIAEKQIKFVNSFLTMVEGHNQKGVIKHMNKAYRIEQIKFLEGDKNQFVNELFGGMDINSNEFINIEFTEITKIEVAEVIPLKDGSFNYIFRIRDGKHDVMRSLTLVIDGKKYGLVGAQG